MVKGESAVVLLIEDEPPDAKMVELAFRSVPITPRLVWVQTIDQALSYLAESSREVALVLLDLEVQGRRGTLVLDALRRAGREIPVVVLSGSTDAVDHDVCLKAGAKQFLSKPASPIEYRRMAERLTSRFIAS